MPASRICSFGTNSLSTLDDCNVSQEFADVLTDEHSEAHEWGIPKMQGQTRLLPHPRPFILRMPPP
jgi:hypothetical protein